jgi:hypothetical protein
VPAPAFASSLSLLNLNLNPPAGNSPSDRADVDTCDWFKLSLRAATDPLQYSATCSRRGLGRTGKGENVSKRKKYRKKVVDALNVDK